MATFFLQQYGLFGGDELSLNEGARQESPRQKRRVKKQDADSWSPFDLRMAALRGVTRADLNAMRRRSTAASAIAGVRAVERLVAQGVLSAAEGTRLVTKDEESLLCL